MTYELDKNALPRPGAGDVGHRLVKAVASAVPVVGSPAAELFDALIKPPLERRRERWFQALADRVRELEQKVDGLTIEKLFENDAFVTAFLRASQAAMRTHQDEKLEMLRNAVVNTVLPGAPGDDLQQLFINLADDLSTLHMRLLDLLDDPKNWAERHRITFPDWSIGGKSALVEYAFPDLKGQRGFYDAIVRDLHSRGLLAMDTLHVTTTGHGILQSATTPLGKQFVKFISA